MALFTKNFSMWLTRPISDSYVNDCTQSMVDSTKNENLLLKMSQKRPK